MSALSFKMVRRMHIASTLIAGGVRPVNVAAATRLDRKYLSNMWREVQVFSDKKVSSWINHIPLILCFEQLPHFTKYHPEQPYGLCRPR